MGPWIICIIASLAIMLLAASGKEDNFSPDNNMICDPADTYYESCENLNVMKKNYFDPYPFDYNEDENLARYYKEFTFTEEKRNRGRVGCDCHTKVEYVYAGPSSYPQFYKNVTCQDHHPLPGTKKCMKGFHCQPVKYPVTILQRKNKESDPNDLNDDDNTLPIEFRKCWRKTILHAIAACMCVPQ